MSVLMVRSKVKAESVPEVEAAIEKVFAAIGQARQAVDGRAADRRLP
jgi:hypothetical protein